MDKLFGQVDNVAAGEQNTMTAKIEDAALGHATHIEGDDRDFEKTGARPHVNEATS